MTRDDIIRMAREAGLTREDHHAIDIPLQLFAALVAAAAKAEEREARAKVAEAWDETHPSTNYGKCIANEICKRGQE